VIARTATHGPLAGLACPVVVPVVAKDAGHAGGYVGLADLIGGERATVLTYRPGMSQAA